MTRFDGRLAPIAVATRNGLEESVHHGAGVAIDVAGVPRATIGDPDLVVYPRSSLKPLQAQAMIAAGLELDDAQLAVACASHDGSAMHLDAVRSILVRYGLDESDLANTPTRPSGAAPRAAARAAGIEPSSIQQNCSGKHAAMLATCCVNGWPTDGYLDPGHPVQVAITELPLAFRMPLVLKEIAGFSLRDIAQIMGIPAATVKTRLHRARLRLRDALETALPKRDVPPPEFSRQVCLDLLHAKLDSMDRGTGFQFPGEIVCARCSEFFATLDLAQDVCLDIAAGQMPAALRAQLLAGEK